MRTILLLAIVGLCFSHCKKQRPGFDAYFYTSTSSSTNRYLYIDKRMVGVLPYGERMPDCEEVSLNNRILFTGLSSGTHWVEVKDVDGRVVFSEKLILKKRAGYTDVSSSITKKRWNTKVKVKDDCLIIELIY